MRTGFDPLSFLVLSVAGWLNQRQQHVIEYLVEENRVLREQIGARRLLFTDDQRRRLAVKAKRLGRKVLAEVPTLVINRGIPVGSFSSPAGVRYFELARVKR